MKTKTVTPTGNIVKKYCQINSDDCINKNEIIPVTIILVDDKNIHVCKRCLDSMIREEKWYIKGARVC